MDVPGEGLQVVVALLGAEVPGAQYVLDLPWDQQLLELGRQRVAPMGDVEVAQHQDQLTTTQTGESPTGGSETGFTARARTSPEPPHTFEGLSL